MGADPRTYSEEISISDIKKSRKQQNKLLMYFSNHLSAALASCGKLSRTPVTTLITLIVIGIALALPTSLFVLLANMKLVSQNWNDSSQISLYLKTNISPAQTQELMNHLKHQSGIAQVKYISPQQGLAEFEMQTDFQNALSALNENPLPGVIVVQPQTTSQSPEEINQLLQNLKQLPLVDVAQLDLQWIKRLYAMIDLGKRIVYALGFLLGLGVLFIIGNTIHLSLQKYRREIEVFKLIGATDSFIRRPFLYTGILYGLSGSLIAWFSVSVLLWWLQIPVSRLTILYESHFQLQNLTFYSITILLFTGIMLGLAGAWLAVGNHLRKV